MRKPIIQCLLCGFLTFGIVEALLFRYFQHNVKNEQKTIRESASIWSLEKDVPQQINHGSEQNIDDEPEFEHLKSYSEAIGKFNHSDPEFYSGFFKYGLNIIISRSVGIRRDVPDTRDKICHRKWYPHHLPTASIIICFHNEELNALLRTLSSVVNLTPSHLLEEIILVDDMSEFDDLKEELDQKLEDFRGVVKLIRSKRREGLIRARLIGAAHASGDVLVFLDSHCEVNKVWLEPLLNVIAKDPHAVVCPIIDVIDEMTLEYKPSPIVRGTFNWMLQFKWDNVFSYEMDGPEGAAKPIRSPSMAGGIFAIHRHYFKEIGQYDKDMDLWGGENVEISLRIWMCGGQLFIIPCSRVGHITRKSPEPNLVVTKAVTRNYLRLVHTWLDEYKEQFFLHRPGLRSIPYGNISERVELRKRLGCKSFQWYLDTVFPELEATMDSR